MWNVETGTPVTPDTLFQAGSAGKMLTAAAVLVTAADGWLGLGALAVFGCGGGKTALPHAVYANSVPIYPGARLEDMMGSTSVGDQMWDGMCWFFDVKAPMDKMVAFYEKKYPNAKRDPDWIDGVRLVWTPEGAEAGEELAIVTPIPGTTRDYVRATVSIEGVPILIGEQAADREPVADPLSGNVSNDAANGLHQCVSVSRTDFDHDFLSSAASRRSSLVSRPTFWTLCALS